MCGGMCVHLSPGTNNVLARLPRAVSSVSRDDFQPQGLDQRSDDTAVPPGNFAKPQAWDARAVSSPAATASRSRSRASASPAAIRPPKRLRDARPASRNVRARPRPASSAAVASSAVSQSSRAETRLDPTAQPPAPDPAMPLAADPGPASGRTTRPRPRPRPDRPATSGAGGPAAAGPPRRPRPARPRVTTTTPRWSRWSPPLVPRPTATRFPAMRAPRPPTRSWRDLALPSR